jgi:hypothetical protein
VPRQGWGDVSALDLGQCGEQCLGLDLSRVDRFDEVYAKFVGALGVGVIADNHMLSDQVMEITDGLMKRR